MSACAFCRDDVIAWQSFYEGELMRALVDHRPLSEGHCLIVPKAHRERFEDLTPEERAEAFDLIIKVHKAACAVFGEADYLILQKNGASAGQSVPHVHFHYVRNSTALQWVWFLKFFFPFMSTQLSLEAQADIRDRLAKACAGLESVQRGDVEPAA